MGGTAVLVAGFTSHITRFFPHPPAPLPGGKGEIFSFLMQGASPLASPGLNPGGAGAGGAILRRAGGLPQRCRITLPSLSPMGGTAVLVAGFTSHITRFFPHPPDPRSQSALPPWGRGRFLVFLCKGLRPLHPRGLNPGGAGTGAAYHAPVGGLPRRCRITLPSLSPTGGTAVLVAGFTSHITKFYPLSPRPALAERSSPMGKGEFFWFSYARGFAPCIPGAEPGRHRSRGGVSRASGGLPRRCRMTLPSLSPTGGTAVLVAGFTSHITKFYPLSPRPALAERSSPMGKGEIFGLFRRGLPPPAPLRLNPGGTGAGGSVSAPTGGAGGAGTVCHGAGRERRTASAIHSGKVLGGLGASFKKPPNASLPWCPAGRVCHGAGANAGLHQQFIREKFLGVWGLLSRSPQRFFVSSFLRVFSVIPHLRSADSMT